MRNSSLALVTLAAAVAMLPAAASSSTGGASILKTRDYVRHIAAAGLRVAAATNGLHARLQPACDRIVVWNPAKRTISKINTNVNCPIDRSGINEVPNVALAGNRVAWVEASGGNSLGFVLQSRVLGQKKTNAIVFTSNGYGAGATPDGDWIGNVVGHGRLLVYDRWSLCTAYPATVTNPSDYGDHCDQTASGDHQDYIFSDQKLLKIVGSKSVAIASAPNVEAVSLHIAGFVISPYSLAVASVDANRVATQRPDGNVTIYSATGAVLQTIPIPSGAFAGTALRGSQLVTLRDDNLELYDVDTGALTSTTPVASGAVLRDLQSGLAVYVLGRKVHVLRLSDGKDIAYSPPGKGAVDAQIESSGLFYSYNFPGGLDHGRIAFVSHAKLLKKLG